MKTQEINKPCEFSITEIADTKCPVQASGWVSHPDTAGSERYNFEFRSRWDSWSIEVFDTSSEPIFFTKKYYGRPPSAGYIEVEEIIGLINIGVKEFWKLSIKS